MLEFWTKISKNKLREKHFNGRIVVVVGTVANHVRLFILSQGLKVVALKFAAEARKRIQTTKGKCLTLDQLAQIAPTGNNLILVRDPRGIAIEKTKDIPDLYPG